MAVASQSLLAGTYFLIGNVDLAPLVAGVFSGPALTLGRLMRANSYSKNVEVTRADVTAIDFSEKMLEQAPAKAEKAGIKNIMIVSGEEHAGEGLTCGF